jgi:hypothetical protein
MASKLKNDSKDAPWRLGLVTDARGQTRLMAVVGGDRSFRAEYVDLLAPVPSSSGADFDPNRFVVLLIGKHIADLHRLVAQCLRDAGLRSRFVQLSQESSGFALAA